MTVDSAVLVLEDGSRFEGSRYAATGACFGELVFATGMTGYQETLTDPSYAGQIVMMTAPHIGITGVNAADDESTRVWVSGFVVRDPSRMSSNHRSELSLDEYLANQNIVGICGIDTRAITLRLRNVGVMRAGIFSGKAYGQDPETQLDQVLGSAQMTGQNLSSTVSTTSAYRLDAIGDRVGLVAVLDLGVKRSTLDKLRERGFDVVVIPESSTIEFLTEIAPDAVFYSNGPGDPSASDSQVAVLQEVLRQQIPFFGICFGNQLLGRALGFETYKLPFGHRGINQPVLDRKSGRTEVTAHNHGFAVDMPTDGAVKSPAGFGMVEASHLNLNDGVVEGIQALDIPAFSVQYHPEAAAGPHDADYLFDRFRQLVVDKKVLG
ncbi:MAG: glutamine-hydrolyzing carbamoyl-phosphate synthase small subunit [Microbacteriaceae bacterium]|nr:glutamine-hydrolyzing carbamoyl-phosphate synthase small subunit [Microbacteriaceae bacterium]